MNPHIDLIYFFSSLVMVAGPLTVFTWLTWLVVKAYRNRQRESGQSR
jgi:hypothetical protein